MITRQNLKSFWHVSLASRFPILQAMHVWHFKAFVTSTKKLTFNKSL